MRKTIAGIAASLCLTSASLASAAPPMDRAALESALTYGLPHAFAGVENACRTSLPADSYIVSNSDRLQQRFAEAAEGSWPQAKTALMAISMKESGDDDTAAMFASMPDDNLRPFVDGMITSLLVKDMTPARCADIDEGLALLDPLPVKNLVGFVGFMLGMMERDKASKSQGNVAPAEGD